jgi:putative nucleotidyltransferase with HDIG domain
LSPAKLPPQLSKVKEAVDHTRSLVNSRILPQKRIQTTISPVAEVLNTTPTDSFKVVCSSAEATDRPETQQLAENVIEEFWFGDDDPVRSHVQASGSMAAAVALATGLKPFPVIAQRVLQVTQSPDASPVALSRLVESDPGLAAKVLRVANSALYSPTRQCTSIEQATMRIGMRNIGRIVVTLIAHGMFSETDPFSVRVREHCVGVSVLARRFAVDVRAVDADDLFLAGLLHDVGKLLAKQTREIDYAKLESDASEFPEKQHIFERRLVGWDHAVLAAHIIEHWQLPRNIATIVAWHHQPGRAFAQGGAIAQSVAILRLADRVDYQMSFDRSANDEFITRLEHENAFEYTHYDGATLRATWSTLTKLIDEGKALIGNS